MEHAHAGAEHPKIAARLRGAPDERRRLRAAARFGVSPRRFDGWEHTETHTLHYDDPDRPGRVTSITVTRDPEFDEQQQALIEADQLIIDSTCDKCGNDLHESLIPPGEVDSPRWFVDEDNVCQACAALEARQRQMHDAHKDDKATTPRPKKAPPPDPPLFMDGRIFRVRPATPDEVQAAERGPG